MKDSEKLKLRNPDLYYAILQWKDNHLYWFSITIGKDSLADCSKDEIKIVVDKMLADCF